MICAFAMDGTWLQRGADIGASLALIAARVPRGPVRNSYGSSSRLIV